MRFRIDPNTDMRIRDTATSGATGRIEAPQPVRPLSQRASRTHAPPPFNVVDRVTLSPEAREKLRQSQLQAGSLSAEDPIPLQLTYDAAPAKSAEEERGLALISSAALESDPQKRPLRGA